MNFNEHAFPAYLPANDKEGYREQSFKGFTKLEYAAITIAAGMAANQQDYSIPVIAATAATIAKAVLEECNK